jgi:hypothetical protein
MDDQPAKDWWKSKTCIAAIGTIAVGLAQLYNAATGKNLDLESIRYYVENGASLALGAATIVGGVISLVGRFKAKEPIKPVQPPPLPWRKDNLQPPQ